MFVRANALENISLIDGIGTTKWRSVDGWQKAWRHEILDACTQRKTIRNTNARGVSDEKAGRYRCADDEDCTAGKNVQTSIKFLPLRRRVFSSGSKRV